MSKKGDHQIAGYFDFVVPPLEGFWWQMQSQSVRGGENGAQTEPTDKTGIDYAHVENSYHIA